MPTVLSPLTDDPSEGRGGYDPSHERIRLSEPLHTQYGHRMRYALAAGLLRPGATVVDAACGSGYGRLILSERRGVRYIGVDRDLSVVEVGDQPGELDGSRLIEADLSEWEPDFEVDVAVCFETLEHVDRIDRLAGWLRKAGTLVLSVPVGPTGSPWHVRVFQNSDIEAMFGSMHLRSYLWQPGEQSGIWVFER